jgi:hypothetical protein
MMFGTIKSKIEKVLSESYINEKEFKMNIFLFNEMVLKDKNLKKIFFLYDELSSKKGLNEEIAKDFLNESQVIFENVVNKIKPQTINELNLWVGNVKCKNEYKNIDEFFSTNVLTLENKIKSKKIILENIQKNPETENQDVVQVPFSKMYKVANKTVNDYLNTLSESERKEVNKILKESDQKLKIEFDVIKENVVDKLNKILNEESSDDVVTTIKETLNKVEKEEYNKINYVKLKKLNKSI